MDKLSMKNPLFEKLSSSPPTWWLALVNDKDLSIQIRKNNCIDVYFNGGAIIRSLKYDGKAFHGKLHYKYIPLARGRDDYVPFAFKNGSVEFGEVRVMSLKSFSKDSLRLIKENISKYYPPESEKGIQYAFAKNDFCFIDTEFEYSYLDEGLKKTIRIDLVRVDLSAKKVVFVEVKTIGDQRLFNDEIKVQMREYHQFIAKHKGELLEYYKKVIEIKRRLHLLRGCLEKASLEGFDVLEKSLFLFGDCTQKWINDNSPQIDDKIREYAAGSYYFGAPVRDCGIIGASRGNRHIF